MHGTWNRVPGLPSCHLAISSTFGRVALKPKTFTSQATGIFHFNPLFTAVPNYHAWYHDDIISWPAWISGARKSTCQKQVATTGFSQTLDICCIPTERNIPESICHPYMNWTPRQEPNLSSFIHRSTDLFQIYARTSYKKNWQEFWMKVNQNDTSLQRHTMPC